MTDNTNIIYDAQKKSVLVAYVLLFFVGMFGGHRFYNNRIGSAVAILCLTLVSILLTVVGIGIVLIFIPFIWCFIDIFLIPGMVRDFNTQLASQLGAKKISTET